MAKTQFWLEPMSTEMLNLPEVVSDSHLKLALERLYWVHVESFPMHLGNRISPQVVTELIGVMSHGQADRMTSSASTFPYTAEKCKEFLCLLNPRQGQPLDGYTLCFVARLWGAIVNSRFATYYGEEHAQLDRLQRMLPSDDADCPWISLVAHHTCWGMPNLFKSQLQDIFVDDRVFVDQWASFMSRCVDDWSQSLRWTFPALISSVGLSLLPGASLFSALPSIFSCSSGILSASVLLLRHQRLPEANASTAVSSLLVSIFHPPNPLHFTSGALPSGREIRNFWFSSLSGRFQSPEGFLSLGNWVPNPSVYLYSLEFGQQDDNARC